MEEKTTKELIREELKKLSDLSWKERLEYIWDYYKPLMAAVIAVIILISVGTTIYRNMQIETLLNVIFVNSSNILGDSESMNADFVECIGGLKKNQEIVMDTSFSIADDGSQYSMASQTKMTALASVGSIDIMVMDEDVFEHYYEAGNFADLSEILSAEQLEEWADLLIERKPSEESNDTEKETVTAAIDLSEAPALKKYELYNGEKLYGGVFAGKEKNELYGEFFEFLLK